LKKHLLFFAVFFITIGVLLMGCINKSNNSNNPNNSNNDIIFPGTPEIPMPFNDLTAAALTAHIKIGWNLGNTLDAVGDRRGFSWLGGGVYANTSVTQMETAWGNPVTSKATITALKDAGFNTIRIPVSWSKAVDSEYNIREDWMIRVIEIVNYAVENDMYVIINSHHDEEIFKFTNADAEKSLEAFGKIWDQIARAFRNYDEKLIFEALNEPRTKGATWEWTGGIIFEHINLNKHYQLFIDTVRASGGNNGKRILMVNTYAASAEQIAMNGLAIPVDTVPDKIVVSIHSYSPYDFALNTRSPINSWSMEDLSDTMPITSFIDRAYDTFISRGIPVILGEFGAMNKNNEEARAQWAEFYVKTAMGKGMPCIWWDNGAFTGNGELFGIINRRNNTFPYPMVISGLMQGVSGWADPSK